MSTLVDEKFKYLLINYFRAIGNNHEIQQIFVENNILFFDDLTVCNKPILLGQKRKDRINTVGFKDQRINLINNVILYYDFVCQNDNDVVAEEPDQWVMAAFKKQRSRGCPKSTATYTTSLAGNVTKTTSIGTVPISQTKKHVHALLSWKWGKQDPTLYPIFKND